MTVGMHDSDTPPPAPHFTPRQLPPKFEPAMKNERIRYREWASLQSSLLWAYSGPVPSEGLEGDYSDDSISCWLIRKGAVYLKTGEQEVTAEPGDWVFVASPNRYQKFSPASEILSIHFNFFWPGTQPVYDHSKNRILKAEKIPKLEKVAQELVNLLNLSFPGAGAFLPSEQCNCNEYLRLQALLPDFLQEYIHAQEQMGIQPSRLFQQSDKVLDCIAMIDRLPLDQRLNQKAISERLGLSRSRLDVIFSSEMDMTPRQYLENRRLNTAIELLKHTQKSIKLIAIETGFRHESHFCSWFKQLTSQRPSELRKAYSRNPVAVDMAVNVIRSGD